MNLQQVFRLSFISLFAIILSSCGDSEDYVMASPSSDALIYGFKLECIARNATDSINYPIMAETKFVIDQNNGLIYNPDSLPHNTKLQKFAATIAFNTSGVSRVRLQYPDSIADWVETSDSIDFSIPLYPKIIITAADQTTQKTYTIDVRVHKIDPDILAWHNVSESGLIQQPSTIVEQKTVLKNNTFHTFSVDTDKQLYLHKATKGATYDSKIAITGLPADKIDIQSITLFNNTFYAVDSDKKSYTSTDGVRWEAGNSDVKNILGVLPAKEKANDVLLVLIEKDGKYSLATTSDLVSLETVKSLKTEVGGEDELFPVSGFSAVSNFDRNNLDKNLLLLTGGVTANGTKLNQTWLIQLTKDNTLRLIPSSTHKQFATGNGISSFLYDDHLYAIAANKLYKSISYGTRWTTAPDSEALHSEMKKAKNQSIIVDEGNYIWIFGGIQNDNTPIHEVWRGRLNKLNPKK